MGHTYNRPVNLTGTALNDRIHNLYIASKQNDFSLIRQLQDIAELKLCYINKFQCCSIIYLRLIVFTMFSLLHANNVINSLGHSTYRCLRWHAEQELHTNLQVSVCWPTHASACITASLWICWSVFGEVSLLMFQGDWFLFKFGACGVSLFIGGEHKMCGSINKLW